MTTIEYKSTTDITINGKPVKFAHFRVISIAYGQTVEPRGGVTIAYVGDKETVHMAGVAICSAEDNFNYHYGRQKAVGRLLQGIKAGLPGDPMEQDVIDDWHAKLPKFLKDEPREDVVNFFETLGYMRW